MSKILTKIKIEKEFKNLGKLEKKGIQFVSSLLKKYNIKHEILYKTIPIIDYSIDIIYNNCNVAEAFCVGSIPEIWFENTTESLKILQILEKDESVVIPDKSHYRIFHEEKPIIKNKRHYFNNQIILYLEKIN